jgi:hypothetical protein
MLALARVNIRDHLDMLGLVTELMERKKMLFPGFKRMIIQHETTELGKGFYMAIASTSEEQDSRKMIPPLERRVRPLRGASRGEF